MCKNCKPKEATPAAEAGTLTDQLALLVRDLSRPLVNHYNDALTDYNEDYIEGLEGMIDRAEKLLATYEESRTRNPEPPALPERGFRYFTSRSSNYYVWRMLPTTKVGEVRFGPGQPWLDSMWNLEEMLAMSTTHPEIPNPDL